MKILWIWFALLFLPLNAFSQQVGFKPPDGWRAAENGQLAKHVKVLVVGKGKGAMPPSLNLGYEPFRGTLSDYLQIVKEFNRSQGDPWKDLGTIETEAGPASLSQVEIHTQWGTLKEMHVMIAHKGVVYILTAAALKEEFSSFYPLFFEAFRSLRIVE